ncbi:hypothetical protein CDAR_274121 [Caerostris darwini]|uniref:Uncharacterized protein n=1 Tax=Caerostris darwini TaxID=1538125 RepID=A0AAV4RCA4_9ARAC|nr:hypothetical protein CDAR_274121 [Caerostris darwini]
MSALLCSFPIVLRTKEAVVCNEKRRREVVSHEMSTIHLETSAAAATLPSRRERINTGLPVSISRFLPGTPTRRYTNISFGNQINVLSRLDARAESILNFSEKYYSPHSSPWDNSDKIKWKTESSQLFVSQISSFRAIQFG